MWAALGRVIIFDSIGGGIIKLILNVSVFSNIVSLVMVMSWHCLRLAGVNINILNTEVKSAGSVRYGGENDQFKLRRRAHRTCIRNSACNNYMYYSIHTLAYLKCFNLRARVWRDNSRGYIIHEPQASALCNRDCYGVARVHRIKTHGYTRVCVKVLSAITLPSTNQFCVLLVSQVYYLVEVGGVKRKACLAHEATFWACRTSCLPLLLCIKLLMHTIVCITWFKMQSCDRSKALWLVKGHVISTK